MITQDSRRDCAQRFPTLMIENHPSRANFTSSKLGVKQFSNTKGINLSLFQKNIFTYNLVQSHARAFLADQRYYRLRTPQFCHIFDLAPLSEMQDHLPLFRGVDRMPTRAPIFCTLDFRQHAYDNFTAYQEDLERYLRKERRVAQYGKDVVIPVPNEKHKVCQVCSVIFHDFLTHVASPEHSACVQRDRDLYAEIDGIVLDLDREFAWQKKAEKEMRQRKRVKARRDYLNVVSEDTQSALNLQKKLSNNQPVSIENTAAPSSLLVAQVQNQFSTSLPQ